MAGPKLHCLNAKIERLAIGTTKDRDTGLKGLNQMLHISKQAGVAE